MEINLYKDQRLLGNLLAQRMQIWSISIMKWQIFIILFLFRSYAGICSYNIDDFNNLQRQLAAGQPVVAINFDLRNADLRNLNLESANFSNANLKGADFYGTNLKGALFVNADLSKANLSYAKLIEADLEHATLNGVRLNGTKLRNIKYSSLRSAKGTLFEDKNTLLDKLQDEERIYRIKQKFLDGQVVSITIRDLSPLRSIHEGLYAKLDKLHSKQQRYVVLDFRMIDAVDGSRAHLTQDFFTFLQTPLYKTLVKGIRPICNHQALIVFLQNQNPLPPKKPYRRLDLHSENPLSVKYQLITQFIKQSHQQRRSTVEIITGRGLHNPHGNMGILWGLCGKYLQKKEFNPYIQAIDPVYKQGGWRVMLKTKVRNTFSSITITSSNHPSFKNPKLILIPPKGQTKLAPVKAPKKSKKRSSNTLGAYLNQPD